MYIILKDDLVITCIGYEPDSADLLARGETCIESTDQVMPGYKYVNGVFVASTIITYTENTMPASIESVRTARDAALASTSYIFQRQLTGTDSQKLSEANYQLWVTYWQQLRDITTNINLANVVWPVPPTIK